MYAMEQEMNIYFFTGIVFQMMGLTNPLGIYTGEPYEPPETDPGEGQCIIMECIIHKNDEDMECNILN